MSMVAVFKLEGDLDDVRLMLLSFSKLIPKERRENFRKLVAKAKSVEQLTTMLTKKRMNMSMADEYRLEGWIVGWAKGLAKSRA